MCTNDCHLVCSWFLNQILMLMSKWQEVLGQRYSDADQHMNLSSFFDEEKLRNSRVKLHTFYHAFVVGRIIADHIASVSLQNS